VVPAGTAPVTLRSRISPADRAAPRATPQGVVEHLRSRVDRADIESSRLAFRSIGFLLDGRNAEVVGARENKFEQKTENTNESMTTARAQ
jgi:hypothetical protein